MNDTMFVVRTDEQAERIVKALKWRLHNGGSDALEVVISDAAKETARTKRRTRAQNARYWVLLGMIADHVKPQGVQYGANVWHHYFKERLLTPEEVRLPNGRVVKDYPSTAELSKEAFSDYATQVEVWANERGVVMPELV